MSNQKVGSRGEALATEYLKSNGFKVIERNFRCRLGEIDIIAVRSGEIYFIEVKARRDDAFGDPFESVHFHKRKQIMKVASYFLVRQKNEKPCHFGVIGILLGRRGRPEVTFYPDAFETF